MLKCAVLAFAFLCVPSIAYPHTPKLPHGVTCASVRSKVAEHGKFVAWAWARMNGYSRAEILEAKKCLK